MSNKQPMTNNSRLGQSNTLKNVLDEMIREMKIGNKLTEMKIKKIWFEQMQGIIAKNTRGIYLKENTLSIYIESSVLKQELFMAREKICQILNDKLGEKVIKEVIIR
jgi:predicted nucleic acid-binding Zn ribbon protein